MLNDTTVIAECRKDFHGKYILFYRLTKSNIRLDGSIHPSFSVYAYIKGCADDYFDEATVNDLTSCDTKAQRFFNLISEGLVTPVSLRDVAEDFLSET